MIVSNQYYVSFKIPEECNVAKEFEKSNKGWAVIDVGEFVTFKNEEVRWVDIVDDNVWNKNGKG